MRPFLRPFPSGAYINTCLTATLHTDSAYGYALVIDLLIRGYREAITCTTVMNDIGGFRMLLSHRKGWRRDASPHRSLPTRGRRHSMGFAWGSSAGPAVASEAYGARARHHHAARRRAGHVECRAAMLRASQAAPGCACGGRRRRRGTPAARCCRASTSSSPRPEAAGRPGRSGPQRPSR